MSKRTVRTGITAADVRQGDILDTFQVGRIFVKSVQPEGVGRVLIVTEYGMEWRPSLNQGMSRVTFE